MRSVRNHIDKFSFHGIAIMFTKFAVILTILLYIGCIENLSAKCRENLDGLGALFFLPGVGLCGIPPSGNSATINARNAENQRLVCLLFIKTQLDCGKKPKIGFNRSFDEDERQKIQEKIDKIENKRDRK